MDAQESSMEALSDDESLASSDSSASEEGFIPRSALLNGQDTTSHGTVDLLGHLEGGDEYLVSQIAKRRSTKEILGDICLDDGTRESLPHGIGLERVTSLVGTLSLETWRSALTESQREGLLQFLPEPHTSQAVEENLQKLFAGDNFNFGNPLDQFLNELKAGHLTSEATLAKESLVRRQRRRYLLKLENYYRNVRKAIEVHYSMLFGQEGAAGESLEGILKSEVAELRIDSSDHLPMLDQCSQVPSHLRNPQSSLFLGIAECFASAEYDNKKGLSSSELCLFLRKRAGALPCQGHISVHLERHDYVEAALHFLSSTLADHGLSQDQYLLPSLPLLEMDADSQRFFWLHPEIPLDLLQTQLLTLESLFSSQGRRKVDISPKLSKAVAPIRERYEQVARIEAREALLQSQLPANEKELLKEAVMLKGEKQEMKRRRIDILHGILKEEGED